MCDVNEIEGSVDCLFTIEANNGKTDLMVRIDREDLGDILRQIAVCFPEQLITFAQCTAKAAEKFRFTHENTKKEASVLQQQASASRSELKRLHYKIDDIKSKLYDTNYENEEVHEELRQVLNEILPLTNP